MIDVAAALQATKDSLTDADDVSITELMRTGPFKVRHALARRIQTVLVSLDGSAPDDDVALPRALASVLESTGADELWLTLAVLLGELPDRFLLSNALRKSRLDGPMAAISEALASSGVLETENWPNVEVLTNAVVVDLHHTSQTAVTTGIQRVARETVRRWDREHRLHYVRWTHGCRGLRRMQPDEVEWALEGPVGSLGDKKAKRSLPPRHIDASLTLEEDTVVPWRCTVLVPELPAASAQARRYRALAANSKSATGVIGYDCVPLTCSETSADGMAEGFAQYLTAAAHFDRIAAISEAAATEYNGWRLMLRGTAIRGPEIAAFPLTVEATVPSESSLHAARDIMTVGSLPVILAVGSHEPRKNHLAVLHAAEILWREGLEFSLTFVGGNSWKSAQFTDQVAALESAHRPIQTIRAMPDELLWAAYRVAYCTVFVSVHEGYGLPVAESLASGTPVITSNFGSMLEIGRRGGTMLVDPYDDYSIAGAMRDLLQQQALRDRLSEEAAALQWRTWDDYAREVWGFLAGDLETQ